MSREDDLQDEGYHGDPPPYAICAYCEDRMDETETADWPYCSRACALAAERDSGEDEEVTA